VSRFGAGWQSSAGAGLFGDGVVVLDGNAVLVLGVLVLLGNRCTSVHCLQARTKT
jgi:hypothetical protein